jgi:hypothetical protein
MAQENKTGCLVTPLKRLGGLAVVLDRVPGGDPENNRAAGEVYVLTAGSNDATEYHVW